MIHETTSHCPVDTADSPREANSAAERGIRLPCIPELPAGGPPDSASTCTVHSGGNRKLGLSLHIHQNGEMAVPIHGDMIGIKCLEACLHTVSPLCLCVLMMRLLGSLRQMGTPHGLVRSESYAMQV